MRNKEKRAKKEKEKEEERRKENDMYGGGERQGSIRHKWKRKTTTKRQK